MNPFLQFGLTPEQCLIERVNGLSYVDIAEKYHIPLGSCNYYFGNAKREKWYGATHALIPPVLDAGRVRISSTRLRKLLAQGDIAAVNRLAGSAYRYDLTENVFVRQEGWYTSTAVTGQGLPGDGEYNAVLIFLNKSSEDCVLKVAGRKLFIRSSAPLDRITADSIMILS